MMIAAHADASIAVSAKVVAVKGSALASGGGQPLQRGDAVRSGTVIASGATGGVFLRTAPAIGLLTYPSSKVRLDTATVNEGGGGSVTVSMLVGKALFRIDPKVAAGEAPGANIVTILTEEGVIHGSKGSWTVQSEQGRTVVAVGEGATNVSIGRGSAAGGGSGGGQIEVPKGSVIWLFNRGGKIEAELLNTETGMVTQVNADGMIGPSSKASPAMMEQSRRLMNTSQGGDGHEVTLVPSDPSDTPDSGTSGNPDFSSPKPVLPVVSADSP